MVAWNVQASYSMLLLAPVQCLQHPTRNLYPRRMHHNLAYHSDLHDYFPLHTSSSVLCALLTPASLCSARPWFIFSLRSQSCCCLCSRWPVLDFARVKNLLLWPCSCSVSCTSFSTSCFLLCYATFVHHWLTRSCSVCAASIVVLIVAINLNAKTTEMSRDVKGVIIWAGTESYLAIISCEYFRNPKWPAF